MAKKSTKSKKQKKSFKNLTLELVSSKLKKYHETSVNVELFKWIAFLCLFVFLALVNFESKYEAASNKPVNAKPSLAKKLATTTSAKPYTQPTKKDLQFRSKQSMRLTSLQNDPDYAEFEIQQSKEVYEKFPMSSPKKHSGIDFTDSKMHTPNFDTSYEKPHKSSYVQESVGAAKLLMEPKDESPTTENLQTAIPEREHFDQTSLSVGKQQDVADSPSVPLNEKYKNLVVSNSFLIGEPPNQHEEADKILDSLIDSHSQSSSELIPLDLTLKSPPSQKLCHYSHIHFILQLSWCRLARFWRQNDFLG